MKEKRNIVLPVILFIIILGLVGYILIDKGIIEISSATKEETTDKSSITELSPDNANVEALIKQVHNPSQLVDELIFVDGGSLVSDMPEEYKFAIATNTKDTQLIPFETPTEEGYYAMTSEEDVKDAYERLFGQGTYQEIDNFTLGCSPVVYDSTNKRYVTTTESCGVATTPLQMQEEILSITKTEKELTVVTGVLFYDSSAEKLYKDSNLTKELKTEENKELTEEDLKQYIMDNKNQVEQYTYTFDIEKDGFYYYTGVTRTKE